MVGILLTLLAVLCVLALAFCYSDHGNPVKDLHFLYRDRKRKAEQSGDGDKSRISSVPKPR